MIPGMSGRPGKTQSRQDAVLAAARAWQDDRTVQPLTCANDSSHPVLEAVTDGKDVVLACAACGYRQVLVPPVIVRGKRGVGPANAPISMRAGLATLARLMEQKHSVKSSRKAHVKQVQ
jgi:hypothetical protein